MSTYYFIINFGFFHDNGQYSGKEIGNLWVVGGQKRKNRKRLRFFCAHDWIRTSTSLRTPPPQDGVSTNFTTWAVEILVCKYNRFDQ